MKSLDEILREEVQSLVDLDFMGVGVDDACSHILDEDSVFRETVVSRIKFLHAELSERERSGS